MINIQRNIGDLHMTHFDLFSTISQRIINAIISVT